MSAWMHEHPLRTMAIIVAFVLAVFFTSIAAYLNANPDCDPDDYDDWDRP